MEFAAASGEWIRARNLRQGSNLPSMFYIILALLSTLGNSGCRSSSPPASSSPSLSDAPLTVTEYIAQAMDFDCFLPQAQGAKDPLDRWYRVGNFFIKSATRQTRSVLEIARGERSGPYPVGTIVQLVFMEAMVKRGGGFCPEANGWEFFTLTVTAGVPSIQSRGCREVTNFLGGNCFNCHSKARPQFDFICNGDHGCDPLGVTPEIIQGFQEGDERCR